MKKVIIALLNQLKNYPALSYANQSAYLAEDSYELMEKDKFPFFNIVPGDAKIEPGPDDMGKDEFERHIYPLDIQFATSSMELNIAIMGDDSSDTFRIGILDFSNHIWEAVRSDKTLGGIVDGIVPDNTSIPKDFIKDNDKNMFIARAEIRVEFFKDIGLLG